MGHPDDLPHSIIKRTSRSKMQALNLWAEHVMSLVGGRDAKIVPLSARQERVG